MIVLMSTFNIQIMKQVSKFFVFHVCLEIRNECFYVIMFILTKI